MSSNASGCVGHQPLEVLAVHRRFEHRGRTGDLGRAHTDPMHLDVVGMAVSTVVVVDGEHVRAFFLQQACKAARGFLDVGGREAAGCVVRRLALHAGVDVAEELDAIDAEDLGPGSGLGDAAVGERLAFGEHAGAYLAQLATRGDHEHDTVSVGLGACHRAAALDLGVVRMRVERDESLDHAVSFPTRARLGGGARHTSRDAVIVASRNLTLALGNARNTA